MEEKNSKKLSYEELEKYAAQMSAQVQQMYTNMKEMNMANLFKRLDYLFKILENSAMFDPAFVDKCVEEIQSVMTPEENTEETTKEDSETQE